jgi:hypothetical protein
MTMTSAAERIRADLQDLRRARHGAFGLYVLLLGAFLIAAQMFSASPSQPGLWTAALLMFAAGALGSAGLALGVPLLHGTPLRIALGASLALMVAGLLMVVKPGTAVAWDHGPGCFIYGTGVSAVAMVVLGAVSGRLWRRFPDPGFMLAVATTGVGVMALHMRCPSDNVVHLLLFHLGPLAVLYAAARTLTAMRSRVNTDS